MFFWKSSQAKNWLGWGFFDQKFSRTSILPKLDLKIVKPIRCSIEMSDSEILKWKN